jgi:hypothetical protein
MDDYYRGLDLEIVMDYGWILFKLTFACSPIIAIGLLLAFAREDEEEERAKKEQAEKISCKT